MLPFWMWKLARKLGPNGHSSRRPICRPRLESLDERIVPSFFNPPTLAVGSSPVAEALGDFNGDGKFQTQTAYTVGTTPTSVAVGDLNGDGKLDIVTSNFGSNTVSALLGNGDGTFRAKNDIVVGSIPLSVAVGDFNGDGKFDLAVATATAPNDSVTILLGIGDGTFLPPANIITDSAPKGGGPRLEPYSTVAVGDFNGDSKLDLVVVNNKDTTPIPFARFGTSLDFPGSVSVLLGNGDGTFQAPHVFALGTSPGSVAVGDLNGDGRLDFAVGNRDSGTVSVFLGTGDGNFTPRTDIAVGGVPISLVAADLNGDGRSDLLVHPQLSSIMTVLSGQADGTFQTRTYDAPTGPTMTAGDLNGDGQADLVATSPTLNAANGVVSTMLNGDGTFPAPAIVANPGVILSSQAVADFNGDGIADRAILGGQGLEVDLGLGDGNFGDATTYAVSASSLAAADLNGDGIPDLALGSSAFGSKVAEMLNSPNWDSRTGAAVGFTISTPQQITAGATTSVTVTAVDALGNPVSDFHGTVDLDFLQAGSSLQRVAGQYDFTATDGGKHTFIVTQLNMAGTASVSAFAAALPPVSAPLTVVPAQTAKFVINTPPSVVAGTPFSFSVSAEDAFGNLETGYTGTVHFGALASDLQAVLPSDYTFITADAGTHTFSATLTKTQTDAATPFISIRDIGTGVNSTQFVNVTPLAPVSFRVTAIPSQIAAGTPEGVAVSALDVFANLATSYTGTVHFSSSDPNASLPADFTFTATNRGTQTFAVALESVGAQSLTVADTMKPAFTSTQSGIVVRPGTPSVFLLTGTTSTTTAGATQSLTLTVEDAFGNVATNYTGTVHFTSSDSKAGLPANYTFTAEDAGSHTFAFNLKTAGTQSLTVADTSNPALTNTQSGIMVIPAPAAAFAIAGFPATTAGVAQRFTVTVRDAFGNLATGYSGTVTFSSSDPLANLPPNYTFAAADAGVHAFTATLDKAGTQSLTVNDVLTPTLTATQTGIVVSTAAVSHFPISAPATVTQGVGFSITVSAVDNFGNVVTGYRGKVHLTSTAGTSGLPSDFAFSNNDNGVHIFSVTQNTLGFQTLTIVDTTNSAISSSDIVDVLAKG